MRAETLLTASRRVVRFHAIDEAHGGLTSQATLLAMLTLDKQVKLAEARGKLPAPSLQQRVEDLALGIAESGLEASA